MYLRKITAKNISILSQLFEEGNLKPWDNLKLEYNLTNKTYFQWLQLKHAVEHKWKIILNGFVLFVLVLPWRVVKNILSKKDLGRI